VSADASAELGTRAAVIMKDQTKSTLPAAADELAPSEATGTPPATFAIVGIGASAGGLEAATQLLAHLPVETGMAFVLVQHLDRKHDSQARDLLAKVTKMPVIEARRGDRPAPNQVFVIPSSADLTVVGGVFHLVPRTEKGGLHLPIDHFLRSLAADRPRQAIGVILSGTGSDGSQGICEIKAGGGITFAQDESSARHGGMPSSAVQTGMVDFVLPPDAIAREIARIARHSFLVPRAAANQDDEQSFKSILARLRATTQVDFSLYRDTTIRRRMLRRMALRSEDTLSGYEQLLAREPAEIAALYRDLLINVTSFFRDPQVFEVLKRSVFPKILARITGDEPVRVWVPGCSTGQEAYSLAIALLECLDHQATSPRIQIFATDISGSASLDKARAGFYSGKIEAEVSPERLKRFFDAEAEGYRLHKRVRDLCTFARQNVSADPPFSHVDLISCRNVLIYLGPRLQKSVLPTFHYALRPSGFLLLGPSEAIGGFDELFVTVDKQNKIFAKKPTLAAPLLQFGAKNPGGSLSSPAPSASQVLPGSALLHKEADRILLSRFSPAGVLVDDDLEILQFRGRTAPYLEAAPGVANLNLLRMASETMGLELKAAIEEVRARGVAVRRGGVRLRDERGVREIELEVFPVGQPKPREAGFLVLFHEAAAREARTDSDARDGLTGEQREGSYLRQELAAARDHLQSVLEEHDAAKEELTSASEEIQSTNEELQSAVEELETAKEELQSTNEQLTTVNEELASRNVDLVHANEDLLNFIVSADIPIIVLGDDLRIRRISAPAERILDLASADVGLSIADIQLPIEKIELEASIANVVRTGVPAAHEVRDTKGRWRSLRLRPYVTQAGKTDGVVMSLIDIHEIKTSEQLLRHARKRAQMTIDTIREPFLVLDQDLRIESMNQAFARVFKVVPHALVGCPFFEIERGQWDIPALRSLLREIQDTDFSFDDLEFEHEFAGLGRRIMRLNARRVAEFAGEGHRVLLAFWDVTDSVDARRHQADHLKEVVDASASKDLFLATLSHELRTPLNAILGWAQLLASGTLDAVESDEALTAIRRGGRAQAALIADMLDVSRIVSGKLQLVLKPTDIRRDVENAVESLQPEARAKGITLSVSVDDSPCRVFADGTRLQQVVRNLVHNAVKFTPPGGSVDVTLCTKGDVFEVKVADTGIGIDPLFLPQIYDIFRQADSTTTRTHSGLGLGLAISKNLVGLHKGTLTARSEGVGHGATLTLTLPRCEESALPPAREPAVAPAIPPHLGGLRAMVVDDDPDSLRLVAAALKVAGALVTTAVSTDAALLAWSLARPELLVTDIAMPGRDGYSLLRAVRAIEAREGGKVPVLAVTAHATPADRGNVEDVQFDAILTKPIDTDELVRAVSDLVRRAR
jgi:two-component system CheB/CheR fusion protein